MGIHADHWDLDGTSEVEVVVAQVIGAGLNLVFGELRCVVCHLEQDWLGCSDACPVRDQIEVEYSVTLLLNERGVDDCAWTRIETFTVGL